MKNILRKSNFGFKNRIMRMALLRSEPRRLNRSFGGLRAGMVFAAFMTFAAPVSRAALSAGDIAFVMYNADATPDTIAFVALVAISAGEEIKFTDNGWTSSNTWRASEGIFTYTAPAGGVSKGSVVTVSLSSGPTFSTGGDQIIAYQGDSTMIAALNNEGTGVWQADATSASTSALPQNLVNGTTAVALNEIDNAIYNGTLSGTKEELLAAINNNANWTRDDSTVYTWTRGSFTVGAASGPSITTTGTLNSFTATAGTASAAQTFSVTGSNLTADITVTAPADFEVASDGTNFGGTATITQSGGSASGTVSVRVAASASAGAISGNVTLASTTASGSVAVSGFVSGPVALPYGPETFETSQGQFYTYSVAGNKDWSYVINSTLGGGVTTAPPNKAMEVNGFGGDVASNDWLILGPIDASAANNPVVTFNTLTRFANNAVNELTLKVSTDYTGTGSPDGATWTTLTYNVPVANTITKTASGQVALTGAANQNNVYVAWHYQAGGTTSGASGLWQVDDVTVQNALKPALLITAPATINEGVLGTTGTVSIPVALETNLDVTVASSDATELLVDGTGTPAATTTVTIPAGSTSASFFIDTLADDEIDTDQTVTLTASVLDDSYEIGTTTVNVKNLDLPSASLGSSGYTQDFAGFAQSTPTLPTGWSVSGPVTTFNTSTNSSGVLTDVDWGSGTGAGLRGNGSVLGYQHTGSTGTLIKTLVLKNTGTEAITALTISYKGRATRLTETRIPIYTVTVNGTANSALAYSTAEGDLKLKSTVITGLDIQPNKTITISWSSDRGLSSGSSRQIGISEVNVLLGANLTTPILGLASVDAGTLAQTTASVSGSVTGDGGVEVTERGFVYAATSANSDPLVGGTDVNKVADASGGTGSFSAALNGLTANTGYSLKAYAINGQGTSYSSLVTFATLPTPPTFSGTYTQDFTGFTSMTTLPAGWSALSSAGVNNYVGEFNSGSSTGGFYGTTDSPGVLGYLHTSSTGVVNNKLTLINGTGGELTSLYVSYKGRVEATSNTRIPIWTVKVNGATVAELEYSTASGVDELKSTQIMGLSISDGAEFTVNWESDRGQSSGNSRRIGLTDVRVSTSAPNFAPTDITLSANTIAENNAVNAEVGTLSTTDSDVGDSSIYTLVSGTGDADNASFNINGASLRAGVAFDFETKSSYSVRVRTTDSANNTFEKVFTITVTDVVEGTTYSGWLNGAVESDAAFLDYVFGAATPGTLDPGLKPSVAIVPPAGGAGGDTATLVLTYYVRQNTVGLTVTPKTSADLAAGSSGWVTDGVTVDNVGTATTVNGVSVQQKTASVPVSGAKKFLRVEAVQE